MTSDPLVPATEPITEEWLRAVGFKWHEMERQNKKHWLLWIAGAFRNGFTDDQDLGLELAPPIARDDSEWFCWLRSDTSHRYHRFIHIRHLRLTHELKMLVVALSGQTWDPKNHYGGRLLRPGDADRVRAIDGTRLDRKLILETSHPWYEIERDPDRGGALPEHMQAAIDAGKAK